MYTLQSIEEVHHLAVPPKWVRMPSEQKWWGYVLTSPNREDVQGWFNGSYKEAVDYLDDTLNVHGASKYRNNGYC